jgi:hypothetical protein
MSQSSNGQLNLSCGFTPSAAYARHAAAQAPAARGRATHAWADSYERTHDRFVKPEPAPNYAAILRSQQRRGPQAP